MSSKHRRLQEIIVKKISNENLAKGDLADELLEGLTRADNFVENTDSWTENELRLLGAILVLNNRIQILNNKVPLDDVSGGGKRKSRKKSAKGKK